MLHLSVDINWINTNTSGYMKKVTLRAFGTSLTQPSQNNKIGRFFALSLKAYVRACAVTALALTSHVYAQFNPTPAQIEQFKQLSPTQQEQLAKSMGIDFSDIKNALLLDTKPSRASEQESVSQKRTNKNIEVDEIEIDSELLANDEATNENNDLARFGYSLFNFGADAFQPAADIPTPSNYVVGTGDTINVQLFGKENKTLSLTITREGEVQFPSIGPVTLAGLTFNQVRDKINTIAAKQMIGVKASVTMGQLRTVRVFVLGEAKVPGSYVVGSLSTMTNALFASGGITDIGSLRNIQLKRAGKVITTLDVYDLLLKGDTSADARVQAGDVIFIPTLGKSVGISGQVKRPAIYELKSERTVGDVIQLAGGLLPTAFADASRIERISQSGEKKLVNIDISKRSGKQLKVNDADVIEIAAVLNNVDGVVNIEGHIKREGGFAWRKGLRFSDVIDNIDDFKANPDTSIALILRENRQTREVTVRHFSPLKALLNKNTSQDPLLYPRDTIKFFGYENDRSEILTPLKERLATQSNFEQRELIATIYGSIRFPGSYPISQNMTTEDFINLAGGLTESALAQTGEITRFSVDEARKTLVSHINVNLKTSPAKIMPGDTLRVKQVPFWNNKESIILTGEVLNPGTYPIIPGETLMDVLTRAGGLTPHGFPSGAIFSRKELRDLEQERLESLRQQVESELANTSLTESRLTQTADQEQAEQIIKNLSAVKALGRMVIDLPNILSEPELYDFRLEDGDELVIPRFKPSVTVVGEVQYATSHFFNTKLSAFNYIDRSGGMRKSADKKRVYIVKANGRVVLPKSSSWFKHRKYNIEPGDTIVVPLETDKVDRLTLWQSVTSIIGSTAAGIAVFAR